ncbi:Zinc finger CCCH domain-containing protein 48 [Ancistrocladus abbreviatus]
MQILVGWELLEKPMQVFAPTRGDAPISHGKTWNRSSSVDYLNSQRKQRVDTVKADEEFSDLRRQQKASRVNVDVEAYDSQRKNRVRHNETPGTANGGSSTMVQGKKICEYWITGNCLDGEKCCYLHSWYYGDGFTLMTQLEGHKKDITGIALPSGSDKLYTGSRDGTVRIWDCHTGECAAVVNMGAEVGSLISEGPWIFVGIPNAVKAWNIETSAELNLSGPVGQVYAMAVGGNMLLAGAQDGVIRAWKFNSKTSFFEVAACPKGHSRAVVSLVVGANRLYSGSMDNMIRAWDLDTLQCIQTLNGHANVVMSLLCWDQFLLSCSLDRMLKVWVATERGDLEVTYTHQEEDGILALRGIHDAEAKPILFCSCNDNSVCLYELPSFTERGRIFARKEVRTIQMGPGGQFFTGDGTGRLSVWRFLGKSNAS